MSGLQTKTQSLTERLQELPAVWHLWKACIVEELGQLPDGFEDATRQALLEACQDARGALRKALDACDAAIGSMRE